MCNCLKSKQNKPKGQAAFSSPSQGQSLNQIKKTNPPARGATRYQQKLIGGVWRKIPLN